MSIGDEAKVLLGRLRARDVPYIIFGLGPWSLFFWRIRDCSNLLDKENGWALLAFLMILFTAITAVCLRMVYIGSEKVIYEDNKGFPESGPKDYPPTDVVEDEVKKASKLGSGRND